MDAKKKFAIKRLKHHEFNDKLKNMIFVSNVFILVEFLNSVASLGLTIS